MRTIAKMLRRCTVLSVAASLVLLTACPGQPRHNGDPVERKDAGAPDIGGEPVRSLTTRPLFGGMPLDNRMLDPQFDMLDGTGWLAFGGATAREYPLVNRAFLPATPQDQPALKLPKLGNPPGYAVLGLLRSTSGSMAISLWAGRRVDETDLELQNISASLFGLYADGSAAVDILLDATTEPRVLADIEWRRLAVVVPDGPLGWAYLYVDDMADVDLYLSSPIVIAGDQLPALQRRLAISQIARPRPLHAKERAGLEHARQHMLDRLSAPPTPPRARINRPGF